MNVLLIDLSSIAHMEWHTSGNDPNPDACSIKTIARVRALASGQPHVAVCLDSPPYFRSEIDPTYKANRAKDNNAVISHQIGIAVDALREDGLTILAAKGYEADDIIATACTYVSSFVTPVVIASALADKDLFQLVSDTVSVKSVRSGNTYDADGVKAKFGVWPHQIVDYLSLVGDSSDNIKGAKGIGAKRAAEILEMFGNVDDAIKATKEIGQQTALGVSLLEFEARLPTVRDLIRLRTDAPIDCGQIFKERAPMETEGFEDDREPMDEARSVDRGASAEVVAPHPVQEHRQADTQAPRVEAPSINAQVRAAEHAIDAVSERAGMVKAPEAKVPGVIDNAPVAFERQLEPRNMQQVDWLAKQLFQSRLFGAYGTPAAVLSTILAGRELGFQAMASLRAFHIIENKPTLSAGAIHSLILTSGKAKYFRCTERTATRATFETQRGDDPPIVLTFTIEEAQQAWSKDQAAWNRSGWGKNPADMLVARAMTKLARLVYPDVVQGFYSPEEL